jgi:hypothetical protein
LDDQDLPLENHPGDNYEISAGKGFALVLAGYRFRIANMLRVDFLNTMQIAVGADLIQ